MGGKSSKPKVQITDYYASLHYGFCSGADELLELWYGEKLAWNGSANSQRTLTIDKPGLFGGEKVEGGFHGVVEVLPGDADQLLPQAAVDALVRNGASDRSSPAQNPGYRGRFSLFVHGGNVTGRPGAYLSSNIAAIRQVWAKLRRAPADVPFDSTIVVDGMRLANPAAMIWEAKTNREWGEGSSPTIFDQASFASAAATLKAEGFGLAALWDQQEEVDAFVGRILDHIQGSIALDPFSGKIRLKLIRDDYDEADLQVLTPSNFKFEQFSRRGWGETVNEIVGAYTDPANEQTATVSVQNGAVISLLGGEIVSETNEYPYIRTGGLCLRAITRDLLAASSALAICEGTADRSFRGLPGDVVVLDWPHNDVGRLVMRIGDVEYGSPGNSAIRVKMVEDVFALPAAAFVEAPGTGWVNPAIAPTPMQWNSLVAAPYYTVARALGDADAEAIDTTETYDAVFASHPAIGVFGYDVVTQETGPTGDRTWTPDATVSAAARGQLLQPIVPEVESTISSLGELVHAETATVGALVWIGSGEQSAELGLLTAVGANGYTIRRGVLDTVPASWPAGTPVWFLNEFSLGTTNIERAVNERAEVRLLTNTAAGQLDVADAPTLRNNISNRLHRPYRPGNLRAGGELWPAIDWQPGYPLSITWSSRNRLEETTLINAWSSGAYTAEPGTQYRVEVRGLDETGRDIGRVKYETVSASGINVTVDDIEQSQRSAVFIHTTVTATRDGLEAWQSPAITVRTYNRPLAAESGDEFITEDGELLIGRVQ